MLENHMVIDFDYDEESLGFCINRYENIEDVDFDDDFWEENYEEEIEND